MVGTAARKEDSQAVLETIAGISGKDAKHHGNREEQEFRPGVLMIVRNERGSQNEHRVVEEIYRESTFGDEPDPFNKSRPECAIPSSGDEEYAHEYREPDYAEGIIYRRQTVLVDGCG